MNHRHAVGVNELTRAPGIWRGPRRRPTNESEALALWSPVVVAWAIDRELVDGWPLTFTARGRRWIKDWQRGKRQPMDGIEENPTA